MCINIFTSRVEREIVTKGLQIIVTRAREERAYNKRRKYITQHYTTHYHHRITQTKNVNEYSKKYMQYDYQYDIGGHRFYSKRSPNDDDDDHEDDAIFCFSHPSVHSYYCVSAHWSWMNLCLLERFFNAFYHQTSFHEGMLRFQSLHPE